MNKEAKFNASFTVTPTMLRIGKVVPRHDDADSLKGKAVPVQAWTGPEGSRRLRFPEFLDSWYMDVTRLAVLGDGRL
jgi:hypothetical protein